MSALWAVQALVVAVLLGVAAAAAHRVASWFGLPRRGIWAFAMLGSLLLPALSLWAPGLLPGVGLLGRSAAPAALDALVPGVVEGWSAHPLPAGRGSDGLAPVDPRTALLLGWAVLSSLLLGLVAWVFLRLRCIRVACVAAEVDGVPVRVAERIGPAVLGLVRPVVVLPRWALYVPEEERRLILLHEREHIAGGDAWLLFLSTLALVAMPWSLPLWWQHRRLRDALEIDCDARVLARGASRRLYGQILVRTAGCGSRLPLLSPAWGESSSQLRERIMSMTARRPRHRLLRAIPLSALALGVTLAACAVADGDLSPAGPRRSDAPVPPAPTPAPHAPAAPDVDTLRVSRGDPGHGTLGFSYGMTAPIQLRDGEPLPTRTPTYWVVRGVKDGSSALRAGLQAGDTVLAINGIDGRELSAWQSVQRRAPGTPFTLLVRRGTRTLEIAAELDPPRVSGEGR